MELTDDSRLISSLAGLPVKPMVYLVQEFIPLEDKFEFFSQESSDSSDEETMGPAKKKKKQKKKEDKKEKKKKENKSEPKPGMVVIECW